MIIEKPHGNFTPQPERGAYLLREPKGDPDVMLFSDYMLRDRILATANILSVQGITARIAVIENVDLFLKQPHDYQKHFFADLPKIKFGLFQNPAEVDTLSIDADIFDAQTPPAEIARMAVKLLNNEE